MYNTFLLKLIKKTANFAENLKVTTGGGKDIYKSHPFSRGSRYQSYYGTVLSLKSAKKRAMTTCYRSFPSSLRRISGINEKKYRRKSP